MSTFGVKQVDNRHNFSYNVGMDIKNRIISRLYGGCVSGQQLAEELGISRSAVWKYIKSLEKDGFRIRAVPNVGYSLIDSDALSVGGVSRYAGDGWEITVMKETTSTNDEAKKLAAEGVKKAAVLAERQTAGRGRLGRAFVSPYGSGLYVSALIRPAINASDCGRITAFAAVATAQAVEELCGAPVDIKWVNDLYMNGKKICGILTEGSVGMENGELEYAIIGIGVNVTRHSFPPELEDKASSVEQESGRKLDRCELAGAILRRLDETENAVLSGSFVNEYRERSCIIGRTVTVNGEYDARVCGIADDCSLILDRGGEKISFAAGEVTIKPI